MMEQRTLRGVLLAAALLAAGCSSKRERQTPLHDAAEQGDAIRVQMALDSGHPVNAADEGGATPLHAAVLAGNDEVLRILIAEGADVNAADRDGDTPLDFARDRATSGLLRRHGAAPGRTREERPQTKNTQTE